MLRILGWAFVALLVISGPLGWLALACYYAGRYGRPVYRASADSWILADRSDRGDA